MMIGYVTLGTNNLANGVKFYDELLATINVPRFMSGDNFVAWADGDKPGIGLTKPFNGQPATVGNGVMVAIQLDTPEQVDAFYQKALSLGATCEGPSGPRENGFYAGYFRDLDGNKLNAFCMVAQDS